MDLMRTIFGLKKDPVSRAIDDAIELLEEKDFDAAIALIQEKALTRHPGHRRALLHLGIAHMLKGELTTAESILDPIARERQLDSETAAARIAMERIAALKKAAP